MTPAGEEVAAVLASCEWPRRYQARAALPGGRIIYCGIGGVNRPAALADAAALFGTGEAHWTVTKIRRPDRRREGAKP